MCEATIGHLPLELVSRIIDFTSEADPDSTRPTKPKQAYLALVSKQWRDIIESRTFGTITVESSELEVFAKIYGGRRGTQRRAFLHKLNISLDLPGCVDAAASRTTSRAMRGLTRQRNSEAFTKVVRDWFTTLEYWPYNPARDRTINLAIFGPSHSRPLEKVQLLAPDRIPRVHRITSLDCSDSTIRLASLPLVASRLPKLEKFYWDYFDMIKPLNSVRRRRDRYEFAKHLRLLADFPIQQARLKYTNHAPYNQNIEPPSLLLPGSVCDHLCQSLRYFSQLESLSVLDINEAVISPELFWPSEINAEVPFWPSLSVLHVSFNTMAADGGWYYERNRHATPDSDGEDVAPFNPEFESMPPTPERVFAEEEARARDTDFSAESDVSATDSETERQRGRIYNTDDWFRSWPSPKMEALLQAMARAVTRMPRLRQFSAGTWFYDHARGYGVNFEFFYLRAGEQQVVCDAQFEHDDVMKQRLLWNVPELWRMSDAVEQLWRETLGQDGIIEYQEWDD